MFRPSAASSKSSCIAGGILPASNCSIADSRILSASGNFNWLSCNSAACRSAGSPCSSACCNSWRARPARCFSSNCGAAMRTSRIGVGQRVSVMSQKFLAPSIEHSHKNPTPKRCFPFRVTDEFHQLRSRLNHSQLTCHLPAALRTGLESVNNLLSTGRKASAAAQDRQAQLAATFLAHDPDRTAWPRHRAFPALQFARNRGPTVRWTRIWRAGERINAPQMKVRVQHAAKQRIAIAPSGTGCCTNSASAGNASTIGTS